MLKYTGKQWAVIVISFVAAAVVNWLIWFVVMSKPNQIGSVYHLLTIISLAAAFIVIGDKVAKAGIYK